MKKHAPTILTMVTMILCTLALTLQLDDAREDRYELFEDLIEQSWKIQGDMNGLWQERADGGLVRSAPEESAPSLRQLLLDLSVRLDKLEAAD